MERTLADAQEEARAAFARLQQDGNPLGETVYILLGCDCPEQGGTATPYHIHVMDAGLLDQWASFHAGAQPLAAYKP